MTRILVIESETRARHALRAILESAGYEVELAVTASEASRLHARQPAELVITAVVDAQARMNFVGARVLAVPGGCLGRESEVADRVLAIGAQHFLPKPFRRDDLLAAVRVTLNMAPPPADIHPS